MSKGRLKNALPWLLPGVLVLGLEYGWKLLYLIGFAFFGSIIMVLTQSTVHLDSIQVETRTYHLAAYPWLDVNFSLAECDSKGIVCRVVYRSGDFLTPGWESSRLRYRSGRREIVISVPGEGEIFTYPVPSR